jgi:GT2 family glycosyltransferase
MEAVLRVAVLMTCYNRKQKTLKCLRSLQKQELAEFVRLEIYVTDDCSVDGTTNAIQKEFPEVKLYQGTGFLFWAGGMRYTWKKALEFNPDYYLLVNDDTILKPDAVAILLQHRQFVSGPAICIGSTLDEESGKVSYGGRRLLSKRHWKEQIMEATKEFEKCDFGNANIMLVSNEIVNAIGILSDEYTHSLADYDFSIRARKAGFEVLVAPGFLGNCIDDHGNNWKAQNTSLKERIDYLKSPTGLAYREYLFFVRTHFPRSYPMTILKLWLKTVFPFLWNIVKK